jgi:hypothetical protein
MKGADGLWKYRHPSGEDTKAGEFEEGEFDHDFFKTE